MRGRVLGDALMGQGELVDELAPSGQESPRDDLRLRAIVGEHFDFVWRSLRRLGVHAGDVDDAAQRVFLTVAGKLSLIPTGGEKSFLFGVALRVASHARRGYGRRREVGHEEATDMIDAGPSPEESLDARRARALADALLDEMPLDLRAVFVLFEVEEMSIAEIAALLDIPAGTVGSRLRRAREDFHARLKRLHAQANRKTSAP